MHRFMKRALALGSAVALATAGVVGGEVAGAATPDTSWVQFHYSAAHTGWNSTESTLNAANVSGLHQIWQSSAGGLAGTGVGSPIVVGSRVFVLGGDWTQSTLLATDRSGNTLWTTSLGTDVWPSELASGGGLVLVGVGPTLRAYDQATGAPAWSAAIGDVYDATRGPTVAGDRVFVGAGTHVYAFSLATGDPLWAKQLNEDISSFVAWARGRVFVATYDGGTGPTSSLRALSASTGELLWRTTAIGGVYGGGPAVMDGIVYVAGNGSGSEGGGALLAAFRASNGHQLWSRDAGDDVHSVPAVDDSRAYIGTIDGTVHAFAKKTGKLVWTSADPYESPEIWSSISSANGVLYLTNESSVRAMDAATGVELWSSAPATDPGGALMSSVAVVDGRAYVGFGAAGLTVFGLTP
jgi:outer membrane protein assembly factor BamB